MIRALVTSPASGTTGRWSPSFRPVILGEAVPGSVLRIDNPQQLYLLADNGEVLADNGEVLAFGPVEGAYQWYRNGAPVAGATDTTFTVPETANAGDRITVNNSLPLRVAPQPFAVVSAGYTQVSRVLGGPETAEVVADDRVVSRVTNADSVSDYRFTSVVRGAAAVDGWSFASSDPAVATVHPATGFVTYVAAGNATITATLRDQVRSFPLVFAATPGQAVDTFLRFADGSAAKAASDAIDTRIANQHDPAANLRIFSSQNHSTPSYVRNANVWCADLDLTCISPWNSSGGAQRAVTLISPRHVIMAAHYEAGVGATVRFVKMDGTVVTRTMTALLRHPSYVPYFPDISIGLLDSDVPAGISFAKVLPDNWDAYLPCLVTGGVMVAAMGLDQEEKATLQDLSILGNTATFRTPADTKRAALYEDKIVGDSGNPAFLIIGGQLVLLTVWNSSGAGGGTFITPQRGAINTMMTSLGGGYSLTDADLGSFTNYAS